MKKRICSIILACALLISAAIPCSAETAAPAYPCYPDTQVPMAENNIQSISRFYSEVEYGDAETIYQFYYKVKNIFETVIEQYEGNLQEAGFKKTDSVWTKDNNSVKVGTAILRENEYMLVTVTVSLTENDILFNKVNYAAGSEIRVYIDNEALSFATAPQNVNGTVLVPFRTIFETFGMTVDWDADNRVAIGKNDTMEIRIPIGGTAATVNGEEKTLTVPARIIGSSTMIPLRFVSETLGYHVVWTGDSKNVLISAKNIIEWRLGGHDESEPYENYQYRYVNGVQGETKRYIGTYWTPPATSSTTAKAAAYRAAYIAKCESVTYENLLRYEEDYLDKDVYLRGQVLSVVQDGDFTKLIVQVTRMNFGYTDSVHVYVQSTTRYLAGDLLDIYGKSQESIVYNNQTMPYVMGYYLDIVDTTADTSKISYYSGTTIPMLDNVTGLKYEFKQGNGYYYHYYSMPYGFQSDYMFELEDNGFTLASSSDIDDTVIYKKGTQQVVLRTRELNGVRYYVVTVTY